LRHFPDVPSLPNGYFGMFLMSYFPALFFRVMDPRLLAAVGRDPAKINFQPHLRDELLRRYHLLMTSATQPA
jgi:alkane 1-monooxygenase